MAEWEQGGTIMRFAVSPIVGIAAGFISKTQPDCGTTTTGEPLCQPRHAPRSLERTLTPEVNPRAARRVTA
jgi:hypothetical protein